MTALPGTYLNVPLSSNIRVYEIAVPLALCDEIVEVCSSVFLAEHLQRQVTTRPPAAQSHHRIPTLYVRSLIQIRSTRQKQPFHVAQKLS